MMTQREFNKDFWCIIQSNTFKRKPVSYSKLSNLLGDKFNLILNKLATNKNQILIIRPFHGWVYNFYRH